MKVVDSNGSVVPSAPVKENFVSITQNSCGNGQPQPSVCWPVDVNGQFTDTMTINCGGVNGPDHCGYDLTDHWEWCPGGISPQNVGTLYDTTHKDAITTNGVTTPNKISSGTIIYPIP
jgi:hypothetical protein